MPRFSRLVICLMAAALCVVARAPATTASTIYRTKVFRPAFTVRLLPGWTVAERAPDVAQIYKTCAACEHEGEERGEVTFDMALANLRADAAIKLLHRTEGIKAGRVHPFTIGALRGLAFTARRTGSGFEFARSGYRSEMSGPPLQVMVTRIRKRTVTIFIDPHENRAATNRFMTSAQRLLQTTRFAR